MTFDDVPWVVTMKKNDHYFPTTEWIKDESANEGWKRVTYEHGKAIQGEGHDGIVLVSGDDCEDEGTGVI